MNTPKRQSHKEAQHNNAAGVHKPTLSPAGIAALLFLGIGWITSCSHTSKDIESWEQFTHSITPDDKTNIVITPDDINSQTKNTDPYLSTYHAKAYWNADEMFHDSSLVALKNNPKVYLAPGCGSSEIAADTMWKSGVSGANAHDYAYLHKDALIIYLRIQDEVNTALRKKWYKHCPISFIMNSAGRTHAAQTRLANIKNPDGTYKYPTTNRLWAHEVFWASDIVHGAYMGTDDAGNRFEITNPDAIGVINKETQIVLRKYQNNKIFITPESWGVIHMTYLVHGPTYNANAQPIVHPAHRQSQQQDKQTPKNTPHTQEAPSNGPRITLVRQSPWKDIYSYTTSAAGNIWGVKKKTRHLLWKKTEKKEIIVCNAAGKAYAADHRFSAWEKVYVSIIK